MEAFVIYHNINRTYNVVYNLTFAIYMSAIILRCSDQQLSILYLLTYLHHAISYIFSIDEQRTNIIKRYIFQRCLHMYVNLMIILILEYIIGGQLAIAKDIFMVDLLFLIINHPFSG